MKKNNILLYSVLTIAVLVIVSGVLYLYISSSRTIDALYKSIAERDTIIAERDVAISELRSEITDLSSVKPNLTRKLDSETLAKAMVEADLKGLESQFRDATRESMRVESNLVERLAAETAVKTAATENLKILEKNLAGETAANKALLLNLSSAQQNLVSADNLITSLTISKKNLEYNLSVSVRDKSLLSGQLAVAQKLVEGALFQASGKPVSIPGKIVKPVIFVPADVKVSVDILDKMKTAIVKTMAINQLWFFSQTGMTFSPSELVTIRGNKFAMEYDRLSPGERMLEIRREINAPAGEVSIFFIYASNNDRFNWGDDATLTVLIGDQVISLIVNNQSSGWGIVAHELGHVWGLPHLASNEKAAIMKVSEGGYSLAAEFFPDANLTESEKNIVKRNLTK